LFTMFLKTKYPRSLVEFTAFDVHNHSRAALDSMIN
jgi:hypothetical protein